MVHDKIWNTKHEIQFLTNLGFHSLPLGHARDPIKLLKNYIKAAEKREEWGGMNPLTITRYAKSLLDSINVK